MNWNVKLATEHERSDSGITKAAAAALLWNSPIPDGSVHVDVENGWITLTCEVDWSYQAS